MVEEYIKAKRAGDREVRTAVTKGEYPYLPVLDHILEQTGPLAEIPVGLSEIPLSAVVGTRTYGRTNSFARNFMPILAPDTEFASKWQGLCTIHKEEGIRDAVKVYEYMWRFYVEEGNKRVSVLRFFDAPDILANVIRVMPKKTDDKLIRSYYEFTEFYRAAPIYGIEFSEPGCYKALAGMMGLDLVTPWPDDAVMTVRSAFHQFSRLFAAMGGEKLGVSVSDAFFIYARIFRLDSLVNEPDSLLKKRIERIWKEFVAGGIEEGAAIAATPEETEALPKQTPVSSGVKGIKNLLGISAKYTEKNPLRVAFIHGKNKDTSGWTYAHELGRIHLEETYEGLVETLAFENCSDDASVRKAAEAAITDEDDLIITTSPDLMPETLRLAVDYPGTKFLNCSVHLPSKSVRTYSGRMYEAKFLMGCIAASLAKNHRIGYREGVPVYGTISSINAFAIGAAMIDPEAKVYLSWTTQKNTDWREWMSEQGISVFSGPDMIRPQESSREYGIYLYDEQGNIHNLAAPIWNWGRYYELIVHSVLNGSWDAGVLAKQDQPMSYWWGMSAGVIDIVMSEQLPYYTRKLINILKNALIAETLNPFDGELRSQEGLIKEAGSDRLSYEEIITMNWLNDNVIGRIPVIDEIEETSRKKVLINGILEDNQTAPTGDTHESSRNQ